MAGGALDPIFLGSEHRPDEGFTEKKESGLDMQGTLDFYESKKQILNERIPRSDKEIELPIEGRRFILLSDEQISGVLQRFPEQARARSCAKEIEGAPSKWFKKTEDGSQQPTDLPSEALSQTAIIPSYVAFDNRDTLTASIKLFAIQKLCCSREVAEIVATQGLIHEYAHTIITPMLYSTEYPLRLENGEMIDGFDLAMKYADAVDGKGPISHYASFFRDENRKFKTDADPLQPISEDLAEAVAAYILGFVYTKDGDPMKPFEGREDAERIISDILYAEKIEKTGGEA